MRIDVSSVECFLISGYLVVMMLLVIFNNGYKYKCLLDYYVIKFKLKKVNDILCL